MKKIKNKKGFSLTEMLVCVVTLLMVGSICATGTGMSVKSYQQSKFESESQSLKSTLETGIADILRFTSDVKSEGQNVKFTNQYYQIEQGYIDVDAEGHFIVHQNGSATFALVGSNAYAGDLYIVRDSANDEEDFTLTYQNNVFTGKYTIKSKTVNGLSKKCTFTYRTIAE